MLPFSLQNRIESLINSFDSVSALAIARHQLTHRYQSGKKGIPPRKNAGALSPRKGFASSAEAISYIATRLPATFAVLENVLPKAPLQNIASVLDVGSGPGTATMAAALAWPRCEKFHLIEENAFMGRLSQDLLKNLPGTTHQSFSFQHGNFLNLKIDGAFDVVILSYVLIELSSKEQQKMVAKAWESALKGIIIIMPGTPQGYQQLMVARDMLIQAGAFIAAPCPHHKPCPLREDDWCHFSTRLARPSFHRQIKEASLPYEDEKFSYLIALKEPLPARQARIIRKPLHRPGHVMLDLCTSEGKIERQVISRRDKNLYKGATHAKWGESWEPIDILRSL